MIKWKFSPSYIEQYFGKNGCERGLLISGMSKSDRYNLGWGVDVLPESAVQNAGKDWEKQGLSLLGGNGTTVRAKIVNGAYDDYDEQETAGLLAALEKKSAAGDHFEEYLYQTTLCVNQEFVNQYLNYLKGGFDSTAMLYTSSAMEIRFSTSHPDLLHAKWDSDQNCWMITVVDFKLAKKPKLEHKMQVALYVWMLEKKLEEWKAQGLIGGNVKVNTKSACIWNKGKDDPTSFDLDKVFTFLKEFLTDTLKDIVAKIENTANPCDVLSKLEYTIGQKCEWCDNFEYCKKWSKENAPMTLCPYETPQAQHFLKNLQISQPDILTVNGFRAFAGTPANEEILSQSLYWKRFLKTKTDSLDMLSAALAATSQNPAKTYREKNVSSIELPISEKMSIVMTAQKEEGTDRVYAYGMDLFTWSGESRLFDLSGIRNEIQGFMTSNPDINLQFSRDPFTAAPAGSRTQKITISILVKRPDPAVFDQADLLFVRILHQYLQNASDFNARNTVFMDNITIQAYMMDNYELDNIQNMLFELFDNLSAIVSADDKERICNLLFWLQGESLVDSDVDSRPVNTISFPIVLLTTVVNRLYTMPDLVAHSLVDLCSCLEVPYVKYKTLIDSKFKNRISNVLVNKEINEYWNSGNASILSPIVDQITARLDAERKILNRIRGTAKDANGNSLPAHSQLAKVYPPKFELPVSSSNGGSMLGQLEFEAKYESLVAYQKIRQVRAMDIDEAIAEGKVLKTRCTHCAASPVIRTSDGTAVEDDFGNQIYLYDCTFEVLNSDVIFSEDKFTTVFIPNNSAQIDQMRSLLDKKVKSGYNSLVKKGSRIVIPNRDSFQMTNQSGTYYISAKFYTMQEAVGNKTFKALPDDTISLNKEYLVFDYYVDYNLDKIVENVDKIPTITRPNKGMIGDMSDISKFYDVTGENYAADQSLIENTYGMIGEYTFSLSQKQAMQQLYEKNVTLLLGPPGTGKTDFISRALIVLCRLYQSRGKNLRVLVSANSHSAIENVLFAVEEKMNQIPNWEMDIVKAEKFDDKDKRVIGKVRVLDEMNTVLMKPISRPVIVGATCWSTHKSMKKVNLQNFFDVIVIDEASQVRLVDALIPFAYGDDKTRFLVVGDENQLAPIIQGSYEKDENVPFHYGSVFRYLYDCSRLNADAKGNRVSKTLDYVKALEENYRMNDALVEYSARKIYGPAYKAPNAAIATQQLKYAVNVRNYLNTTSLTDGEKDTIEMILDPEYPLVLCIVDDPDITKIMKNEVEWIRMLTRTLENTLAEDQNPSTPGALISDQHTFWGDSSKEGAFGIIAPHHEHIARIKTALSDPASVLTAPWTEEREGLYVGTVDKLQGKQRQAIIVSYGVDNIERALGEGEFIFSRNRLNVSLTRGKKKTIVFLTKALLEYPIEALGYDDKELEEGIEFTCGFKDFMEDESFRKMKVSRTYQPDPGAVITAPMDIHLYKK